MREAVDKAEREQMQIELKRQQAELEAERLREAAMRESTEKNVLQEEYRRGGKRLDFNLILT